MVPDSISLAQLFTTSTCLMAESNDGSLPTPGGGYGTDGYNPTGYGPAGSLGIEFGSPPGQIAGAAVAALNVGLIDCYRFSQECLVKAFEGLHPRLTIFPCTTVQECIAGSRPDLDLLIYYAHGDAASDAKTGQDIRAVRQAFRNVPLIVMSDAEDAQQPETIRNTLRSGARGVIPTRTMGIPMTFAVMRFVKAGGTFAPLDLLLGDQPAPTPEPSASSERFTSRQMTVLSLLKQGKANKTIAHELGMSESTVKVHVRNIMRTMGATNRTQAAYKAQRFTSGPDHAQPSDL